MKDLRAKNIDLVQRLEITLHYRDTISGEMAKVEEAKKKRIEAKKKLEKAKFVVEPIC